MSSYQAVPLGAAEGAKSPKPNTFTINVEKIRLIAYIAFFGMVGFSIVCSNVFVWDNFTCEIDGQAESGKVCSDLMQVFGRENICINWDYQPSAQLTAMVYPLFEYSLILYLLLSHYQVKNDMLNGIFPAEKEKMMTVLFWIKIVLVAWFRMIFVCKVDDPEITIGRFTIDGVTAHTAGFLGLQAGLVLIALENVYYLTYRKQSFWCFSQEMTMNLAYSYLVLLTTITVIKMIWTISILASGTSIVPSSIADVANTGWILFAAVLPVFFALDQMEKDPPMVVTIVNTDVRK
eukprot:CAMPEP_0201713642 /NCGR_PEP_ID=MMETSP0593-20130828/407_1 /ASSEMBLY_ACC=CAM_ASM_000672 /TAXON_ID=267983 /ORGANISM="Skeletonema japonicum, Strain CCMP2506" /LENGTH=290 /DNA_ID=CAMNT_0048202817 /DNA_START=86 /DNA_END=958 /DNA_ORIENTATION=+